MTRPTPPGDLTHRFDGESVGRALALIGDHWTLMILREELFGVRRYGQFVRNLGIPRPTLSLRLRSMVDSGLLERVLYSRGPDRYEYRLTAAGRDLFGAAVMLMRWGDRYLAGPAGPPVVLRHHDCGEAAEPILTCGTCGKEITAQNVTPEPGPAFRDAGIVAALADKRALRPRS
ncbi:MAG TPA: helix-turn-helix domain-containing protein [Solirubrobacteraceae bacterium]|nr:helix-turn-helix domain-containing protein [Solirubrobacteraceae bacterium]